MVNGLSDRSEVVFDDERVVVNAGILLAVTLGQRLGLEKLVDMTVKLGGRPGASRPGRKVLSLIHAMLLGADCIDDCDVLRSGRTEAVLGDSLGYEIGRRFGGPLSLNPPFCRRGLSGLGSEMTP